MKRKTIKKEASPRKENIREKKISYIEVLIQPDKRTKKENAPLPMHSLFYKFQTESLTYF